MSAEEKANDLLYKTVLILDDDIDIVELLADYVEKKGFHTLIETDPWRALKIVKNKPVALIISDYKMPGLTGDEFYQMLRVLNRAPKFIFMTGYIELFPDHLKNDDSLQILSKPFTLRELGKVMDSVDIENLRKSA